VTLGEGYGKSCLIRLLLERKAMITKPRNIKDVLSKLEHVNRIGPSEWQADCPCPDHVTPNGHLAITDAGDKALVRCFNRHDYKEIIGALGFDSLAYGDSDTIEATYDYTDANGKLLYQVVRYSPKTFKTRRPDSKGNWIWNLKGVKRVLYRLPEVLEAKKSQTIYICEGERDCDNLVKIGLAATTNSGGAEKWQPELSEALTDASIVIIPDKDEPGKRHVAKVVSSLYGKAKCIKILGLPDREGHKVKDVSDWLMAGGTKEELQHLASEAAEYRPNNTDDSEQIEANVRYSSFFESDDCLFEQLTTGQFLKYHRRSGDVNVVRHYVTRDAEIRPLDTEEVALGAVKLPSGIAEYGDTAKLLKEIEAHICRYLDVGDSFRKFASYYILLSWLYDRFNTLPYLRFIGDTGCGKSRALDVCGGLCYKATSASGCITPAPIYRMLKRWAGTIILDEADLQNTDEYNEVVKILNCGFERNRPVIRALKDNPENIQVLPTYGPKVFATRRRFKDAALEARCLTEIMQETTRDDIPATLNATFYKEQGELRSKLLLFRLRNHDKVNADDSVSLELKGIEPRLRQISACFASLFAGQPEVLADYQQFIAHHQRELIEQRANTTIGQVVEKLIASIESHTLATNATLDTGELVLDVSAGDIAESLGMTPQAVGGILKTLGLQTRQRRIDGKVRRLIVYDKAKIETLRRRYILPDDVAYVASVATIEDSMSEVATSSSDYDNQPLLGLTPDDVIEIWQAEGSPPIRLSQCETCNDLVKTLRNNTVSEAHIAAITTWLKMILGDKSQTLPTRC
jgi:5S rRNA maturation endonuclease (ribonuclease M5)